MTYPAYAPPPYEPVYAIDHEPPRFRQSGRTALVIAVPVVAVAVTVYLGVWFFPDSDARGTGMSLVLALLPATALVVGLVWLDGYEPEPKRYLVAAFVWGGAVSVALALGSGWLVEQWFDPSAKISLAVSAPLTEEPAKALLLVAVMLRRRKVIDSITDGITYAAMVALGFAFTENILYFLVSYVGALESPISGAVGASATFVGRGIMSPFAHPLFTVWFGIAVAVGYRARWRPWRYLLPALSLPFCMLLHGLWNGSTLYGIFYLVNYAAMACLLAGAITWALLARRNEGRVLWQALSHMAARGWLHPDEVPHLARLDLRKQARTYAKHRRGAEVADAVKEYQRLATRMAFLYDGVMSGRPKHDAVAEVDAIRAAMRQLRPRIVLPPPVRLVKRLPRPVAPAWGYYHQGWPRPGFDQARPPWLGPTY